LRLPLPVAIAPLSYPDCWVRRLRGTAFPPAGISAKGEFHLISLRHFVTAIALSAAAVPAAAQQGSALEEIVVTAQRREQSLQEVPVSVTAFTGETLENLKIREAAQYLQLTPNVSYTEDGQVGSRGIRISMRGVSNINNDDNVFVQSIGIYLDELSVSSTANATINPQLIDLERVEVLRGPQGTYFGRNSVGGALNLTTRKPTAEPGVEVSAGLRGYETRGSQYDVSAVVNLPVNDRLLTRTALYWEDNSGMVKNIVPGGGDSGHEYLMGRFALRWLPTDRTTVDWMTMYTNEDQGLDETVPTGVWDTDTVATFFLNNPDGTTFSEPLDDGTGFWPNNREFVAHTAIGEKNDNRSVISVLNIQHALSDTVTLYSITGLIDTKLEKAFDNDLVPEDLVNRREEKEGESWSTELRLEMSTERFDWISGFLYAEDEIVKAPKESILTGRTTAVDGGVFLGEVPGGDPTVPIVMPGVVDFALVGALPPQFELAPGFFLYNNTPDGQPPLCLTCNLRRNEMESWAVYSDFTWHATDRLDLTAGFRYTEDEVYAWTTYFNLFRFPRIPDPSDPSGLTPVPWDNRDTFDDVTPRFSVGFQATDDLRLYGTVSKGYKAGGFTLDFNSAAGAPNNGIVNERFDEETLWNYEIGAKSEWLDRRLRLNLSAFHLEWSDLQIETLFFTVPGDATSIIQRTINIDDAESTGAELEFAFLATDRLSFTGGLGWQDTEIRSDDTASISGNLEVSLQGQTLPRAPEWTWNALADYRWPVAGREFYVRGEWIYRDSQFSTIEDVTYLQSSGALVLSDPTQPATGDNVVAVVPDRSDAFPFKTPDYHLVNLRAGVDWNESLSFDVYVNNVFDEEYYTGTGENFGLSGIRVRPHPRFYGASVTWSFGDM
jgi:iron complex outermembrane recepter protein